ncbi:DUF4150 domain-containing protein [Comamonas fluminis]|uniref:DUF4150 domain-containing protein n=1 Tax=Comamonas fluminis TaxID=2796366 RepID=UPI001C477096|nr:DUF4150 domain-containing protein [Comamonas fluminis]
MFAVTIAGGQCMAMPDVCKVPTPVGTVPTPFPNIAMPPQATNTTTKVLVAGSPAVTKASQIPMTNGDQAGSAGGVISGKIMGKAEFTQGSSKVNLQGKPAVRLSAPTKQNEGNAFGAVMAPSQSKVMIMS